jgi:hypothetical protein
LVLVLPTEPVTATIFARVRARPARASARKPSSTSGTTSSGASAEKESRRAAATTASPTPAVSAAATKSWPSRLSPLMAKNASPAAIVRVSMEMPGTEAGNRPAGAARIAAAIASTDQSGRSIMPPSRQARRRLPHGR